MMRRRGLSSTLRPVIGIAWAGHATALIELGGARILTDPLLRDRVGPLVRTGRPVARDLYEGIDAVLLSHLHADHADVPSLKRVGAPSIIGPRGTRRWLAGRVPADVTEVGPGDELCVGPVRVVA